MKKYQVALWMVEMEDGLTREQIARLMELLQEDEAGYLPIGISGECNSVALGFVGVTYFEELNFDVTSITKCIKPVLNDWDLESDTHEYELEDGTVIYMGCDFETLK